MDNLIMSPDYSGGKPRNTSGYMLNSQQGLESVDWIELNWHVLGLQCKVNTGFRFASFARS